MKKEDCVYVSVCNNECSDSCKRYIQFNRLLELSNLPKMFKKPITINAVEEDYNSFIKLDSIKNDIVNFVNDGKHLFICSTTCGNAKTTWATKLMLKYFDCTWHNSYDITRGLFVHIPTLMIDLKKFDNRPEYIDRIKDADLVIWDDLAANNKLTEYEHEQLLQFIDYRVSNEKSNIYTSNIIDYETLIKSVGGRLASRIYNGSEKVIFISDDYRIGGTL